MRRKKNGSLLRAALLVICLVTLLRAAPASAVGEHDNIDHSKKSSVLFVGDCIVSGMSDVVKKPSYNATVGAHYIYLRGWVTGRWAEKNMVIGSEKYTREMKKTVKRILKKHGKCTVVLLGTTNDTGMYHWEKSSIKGMKKLKKDLQSVRVKGKRAEVYMTSILPERGRDYEVKKFNRMLKKDQGKYYISLGLTSTWSKYYSGSSHLNSKGLKLLHEKIVKAVRKSNKKNSKRK